MIPIVPIFITTAVFGASAWALNKVLEKTTGRDLDENLDYATGKVLEFVKPKDTDAPG